MDQRGRLYGDQSPFNRVAKPAVVRWRATDAPPWVSGAVMDANGASYLR
jgi:hypothetical protein